MNCGRHRPLDSRLRGNDVMCYGMTIEWGNDGRSNLRTRSDPTRGTRGTDDGTDLPRPAIATEEDYPAMQSIRAV